MRLSLLLCCVFAGWLHVLAAWSCGYSYQAFPKPTEKLEGLLSEKIKSESGARTKSEAYYLSLCELARVRHARGQYAEAKRIFDRVSHEADFASNIPESVVSGIWLDAAFFQERSGAKSDALRTLQDVSKMHHRLLEFRGSLLSSDVDSSVGTIMFVARDQVRILQAEGRNAEAISFWEKERNYLNSIGESDLLSPTPGSFGADRDCMKVSWPRPAGFTFPAMPLDSQCYHIKPYRGRTLVLNANAGWSLSPGYRRMLLSLAERRKRSAQRS